MLANVEVADLQGIDPHLHRCLWLTTEPPSNARSRTWRATADDFAIGEGPTVSYGASRARDEDEIPLKSEEDVLARLVRMVNTVGNKTAVNAILKRIVLPSTTGKAESA